MEFDRADGALPSLGPRRLALLAIVAAAGPRGVTRDRVIGILWPEKDEEQARHTLSQTLYLLRRDTGTAWIRGSALLQLDVSVRSDVAAFHAALHAEELASAVALYTGPFLEGFYLTGAPQFEHWVEEIRSRLQFAALKALETLARRAVDADAPAEAKAWWRVQLHETPTAACITLQRDTGWTPIRVTRSSVGGIHAAAFPVNWRVLLQ